MNAAKFLARYGIAELRFGRDADISEREVSRVEVLFGGGTEAAPAGSRVAFKLLEQAADAHRFIQRIGAPPACVADWTAEGSRMGAGEQAAFVSRLLGALADRVEKVHREQSILNIQPVGKNFLLMGRTPFEVLADDGEGQLRIRLHRAEGTSEASLAANDLVDGLYSGLITRVAGSES